MNILEPADGLLAFPWTHPSANNCNTYLIDGDQRILLDPGHAHLFEHVLSRLASRSFSEQDVDVVLVTHGHPDHFEAVSAFRSTRALKGMHAMEMDFLHETGVLKRDLPDETGLEPDFLLVEGSLNVGAMSFEVLHTPGHSPGSFCLYWPQKMALFTGDVVFRGGIGRTDLFGGNGQALKESIRRLRELDVEILLPGHGEIIVGREAVTTNYDDIERAWFASL